MEEILIKDTHSTLADYEALIEQLCRYCSIVLNDKQRENRLDRFITFHRLRTKIDKINIHIEILRQETFKSVTIEARDKGIIKDETGHVFRIEVAQITVIGYVGQSLRNRKFLGPLGAFRESDNSRY